MTRYPTPEWVNYISASEATVKIDSVRRPMRICYNPNTPIVNSSPPGQNGRYFADDIFRCIVVNEKFCILIEISLRFAPKGPINNNTAMV